MNTKNDFTDIFDLEALQQQGWLKSVVFRTSLGSTNDLGLELLKSDTQIPALVLTERQNAGRGRGANRWISSQGALTFSLVLENSTQTPPHLMSLVAGLSIAQSIEFLTQIRPTLKWPNDVYLENGKVAGVLIESNSNGTVVGIGINVNNESKLGTATSLRRVSEIELELQAVLASQIQTFFETLNATQDSHLHLIRKCEKRMLFLNREIILNVSSKEISGTFKGLNESGALILQTPTGSKTIISAQGLRLADNCQ